MLIIKRRVTQSYFDIARTKYKSLIFSLSTTIGIDQIHIDELKSRGDEELLKCMICYNGCGSFITFLYHRLSGVFRHLRDSEIRARRTQSVPFGTIMDVDAVISYCDVESRTTVQECLECLDGKELEIITELFFNNRTIRDIANDYGIVQSTVYRIKTKAIEKIRCKCGI